MDTDTDDAGHTTLDGNWALFDVGSGENWGAVLWPRVVDVDAFSQRLAIQLSGTEAEIQFLARSNNRYSNLLC